MKLVDFLFKQTLTTNGSHKTELIYSLNHAYNVFTN